ncbi:MAG: N-acetylmuramoyl-L-alanine amidase [Gomphosphaeria aponina SAG 52.96 = DSM 107014]|uniref:N-acetylmuramoyl-L-alanine amidase n=1 Tax=Gomphosphaeria aponina SAG 52.96 = DSM 107014 TaxID=1521640 RepID=A0A941GR16_9CHRO|nr:N-acetylmuramoyl-L-alanine amidase [Gomphosphaeria aponina SAG 52.96 = DSM 107014]
MNKIIGLIALSALMTFPNIAQAQQLNLAYPPANHQTTAEKIFFIGTAPPEDTVFINNQPIQRSNAGHFAPSLPLEIGENIFTLRYQNEEITITITRINPEQKIPTEVTFAPDSLTPTANIAKLPGELICFSAVAPPNGQVSVLLNNQTIPLQPQLPTVNLPPNSALLTAENQPKNSSNIGKYQGCTMINKPGFLGKPLFQLNLAEETITQESMGNIEILDPTQLEVREITEIAGITRTGPSTNYSRLTPLPQGTRASVTGKEGEWLRLDYGSWIKAEETQIIPHNIPPKSIIRSITSRQLPGVTEIIFPLEIPVPITVQQGDKTFTLTLYNTTAQTDIIRMDENSLIKRLDWQQITPTQIEYKFNLKSEQQWGYDLKYEGTNLILSLRHPPTITEDLNGIKILLDPGHGGEEIGAKGPTGYPEKDVNLAVAQLLKQALIQRGAMVYLTRETDKYLSLEDRVEMINQLKPDIALSIHYNALPDDGDGINTAGVSAFWYHPQAHNLAVFIQKYLVEKLNRPDYGVFWNNLALTRPHSAPTVLLELGFIINPEEFEWIINQEKQQELAQAIAAAISQWFQLMVDG